MTTSQPLVSASQLQQARRLLFMTHLAIGDFVYQGPLLKALKARYPDLELDVWIDDCRDKPKSWHQGRNDALNQWLAGCSFISRNYPLVSSRKEREALINEAAEKNYDVIVFIAEHRTEKFATVARNIAPGAFIVGTKAKYWQHMWSKWRAFSRLNKSIWLHQIDDAGTRHIKEVYEARFKACFGSLSPAVEDHYGLALHLPMEYTQAAVDKVQKWLTHARREEARFVLINHLSTNDKRNYQWHQVVQLIIALHQLDSRLHFVINTPPDAYRQTVEHISQAPELLTMPTYAFTAVDHFYQLPAMIKACDWVLTVETAIMHLTAVLNKPQVVLMRKQASTWRPLRATAVVTGKRVDSIEISEVVQACQSLLGR